MLVKRVIMLVEDSMFDRDLKPDPDVSHLSPQGAAASRSIILLFFQIIQMFLGCATVAGVWAWNSEEKCKATSEYVIAGGVMYASYLILFIQFFFGAYLSSGIKKVWKKWLHLEHSV